MKKIIPLSLLSIATLYAAEVELAPISVESTVITQVAEHAQTSADVATALSKNIPSVDMIRRSGIANDVLIRGQKRDNIGIDVDGTKVCGACPNRMDPPISHVVANQIDTIEVIEGPYDVENFGVLSGGLKITTKQPTQEGKVELNLGFGAWNYKKFGITGSGGNDFIRMIITASTESSDQYKDGNGRTLAQQVDDFAAKNPTSLPAQGSKYQAQYHDMEAYTKKSLMAKAFITTAKNQELRLSVTANRSDDILYANTTMDALYDDSNIYSVEYNIDNISDIYKNINLQYYYSDVEHPMSTKYRAQGAVNYVTSHLTTTMQGLKLKNSFDVNNYKLLVGLDGSKREWDGRYYKTNVASGVQTPIPTGYSKSIDNTITKNSAIFAKLQKSYNALDVTIGARYDHTKITNDTYVSNTYNAFGANILTSYHLNKSNKVFFGIGQAYRVPDARELYFNKIVPGTPPTLLLTGTPNLQQTRNREIDLGYEIDSDDFSFKIKTFYSSLKDYIYTNAITKKFNNVDATVYGLEISGSYFVTDDTSIDAGLAYKRGKKDNALAGQNDTDLADMAPLRANIAVNYEYANNSIATFGMQASDRWDTIDSDNGEQALAGWAVFDAKVKHSINKKFDFTLGVNNMFDVVYAQSNTYADLTLIGGTQTMLLNEPGRYVYTNLDFKF
ncbi:MAG: TonB-dependent receptor [Sulfurimonas sp.]